MHQQRSTRRDIAAERKPGKNQGQFLPEFLLRIAHDSKHVLLFAVATREFACTRTHTGEN